MALGGAGGQAGCFLEQGTLFAKSRKLLQKKEGDCMHRMSGRYVLKNAKYLFILVAIFTFGVAMTAYAATGSVDKDARKTISKLVVESRGEVSKIETKMGTLSADNSGDFKKGVADIKQGLGKLGSALRKETDKAVASSKVEIAKIIASIKEEIAVLEAKADRKAADGDIEIKEFIAKVKAGIVKMDTSLGETGEKGMADARNEFANVKVAFSKLETKVDTQTKNVSGDIHANIMDIKTGLDSTENSLKDETEKGVKGTKSEISKLKVEVGKLKENAANLGKDSSAEVHRLIQNLELKIKGMEDSFNKK